MSSEKRRKIFDWVSGFLLIVIGFALGQLVAWYGWIW